jgi:hypothetical protein
MGEITQLGDGFLVQVGNDDIWVSRNDIGPFQGRGGRYIQYRQSPLRYQRFHIGWMEPETET